MQLKLGYTIDLKNYLKLAELQAEEQKDRTIVADILHITIQQADEFIVGVQRTRQWCAARYERGMEVMRGVAEDNLTNLQLMCRIGLISGQARKGLETVPNGEQVLSQAWYRGKVRYPVRNLKDIPRGDMEKASWICVGGFGGVGESTLNEMAQIYKALGIENKSLKICDIDRQAAKKKAVEILDEAGFDDTLIHVAFGDAEGELTIPQKRAMRLVLNASRRISAVEVQQLMPMLKS
jgi:hypothetical protein